MYMYMYVGTCTAHFRNLLFTFSCFLCGQQLYPQMLPHVKIPFTNKQLVEYGDYRDIWCSV